MHVSRFIKDNLALIAGIGVPVILVAGFVVAGMLGRWLTPAPAHIAYFVAQDTESAAPAHLELSIGKDQRLRATLRPLDADEKRNTVPARVDVLLAFNAAQGKVVRKDIDIPQGKSSGSFTPSAFKDLKFLSAPQAPDGYSVGYSQNHGGSLARDIFIGHGIEGLRIRKGSAVYRLPEPVLAPTSGHARYSFYNLRFLGWSAAPDKGTKE